MSDRFHVYDPNYDGNGIVGSFATIEEAVVCAENVIVDYRDACDPEWDLGIEDVSVYEGELPGEDEELEDVAKLVAKTAMIDKQERPDDVDDMGYSERLGLDFGSVEFYCDYSMQMVAA